MGLFDNIKVLTDNVSKNVSSIANTIATQAKENDKIKNMEREISVIDNEINAAYSEIGSRYVNYVIETKQMIAIDVRDILAILEGKITRKEELKKEILEIQKRLNEQLVLQEKTRAKEIYLAEKENLDKALAMNIINEREYLDKIRVHKNKIEYFDELKNIDKQFEMGIISYEEREMKINEVLLR